VARSGRDLAKCVWRETSAATTTQRQVGRRRRGGSGGGGPAGGGASCCRTCPAGDGGRIGRGEAGGVGACCRGRDCCCIIIDFDGTCKLHFPPADAPTSQKASA